MRTIREKVNGSYYEALKGILGNEVVARRVLEFYPDIRKLNDASVEELSEIEGMGTSRAKRLIAALALSLHSVNSETKRVIHSPEDMADLVMYEMAGLRQEELWVAHLNTRNHVEKIDKVYKGSLNSSQVRVGELFRGAIKSNAAAIIVIHNHPSGEPNPSPDDVAITKLIIEAGKLLDIQVLDHLVIGTGSFISLNRKGLGFNNE